MFKYLFVLLLSFNTLLICGNTLLAQEQDTLPPLKDNVAPQNFAQMWQGFDPQAEPLETEILKEWEEDGVVLRIVRFRIGVFKGKKAMLAAIYGYPKAAASLGEKLPGLVQIHGGGQYADHRACLMNAKRGYATVSISWAGRISAPEYRVSPNEVQLFWDGKTDDPQYRVTTDWGAVDGYHAPSRNPKNNFPSANPAAWTIDSVESPRNSPWFLCAIAARRAITFLESQDEVDVEKLGVYGHSMGGKLTVMASVDLRVKAAAPSCGGISDRENDSPIFESTICDNVSLKEISCPTIFLSPANDFHGRIGDLPRAVNEIKSKQWRVTCSPHRSHQDSAEYEVATLLWFDEHLKGDFKFPKTPATKLKLQSDNGTPSILVSPDLSREVQAVEVFYSQDGKKVETRFDRENTMNRFWRHASTKQTGETWTANLPLTTIDKPLWVYANVTYKLDEPVSGAGYYYGIYTAKTYNVSSLLEKASPEQLEAANVKAPLKRSHIIETFSNDWQKEWFSNKPDTWPRATHKVYNEQYTAPKNAKLAFAVRAEKPNKLVVMIDGFANVVDINQSGKWQDVVLTTKDFTNLAGDSLPQWAGIKELKLSDAERMRPTRGSSAKAQIVGKNWLGANPEFRDLRWVDEASKNYEVYLLAGQSNMDGRGAAEDLTAVHRQPQDRVRIFYRNPPHSSDGWRFLEPGYSIAPGYKGGLPSPTFGPEIGFAEAMTAADSAKHVALIKGSKGGSSLAKDWNPGVKDQPKTQGPRYRYFIESFRAATKQLTDDGHTFQVRGLLWHQGESDSKSSTEVYQKRFEEFVTRIREDTGVAELPVVVGEVFDNGKRDTVRAALRAVGTSGPLFGFVSADETKTWDDGTHFDAASQLLLGKRYAEAVLKIGKSTSELETPR